MIFIALEEDIDLVQKNIFGEITSNKKTGREINLLVGKSVICDKRKSTIVSDNAIQAERLCDFFINLRKND